MKHACAIPGCPATIDQAAVMCTAHWRMLPRGYRAHVWNTYRKRDKSPAAKRAHIAAIIDAREQVKAAIAAQLQHKPEKEIQS